MSYSGNLSAMARTTKARIVAHTLQIEINELSNRVFAYQSRLEQVADIIIKHGFIPDTPHARYQFINGVAMHNFPSTILEAEIIDVDGELSVVEGKSV